MVNYYESLGLNNNASMDEIKRAFRKLVLLFHPDKNNSNDATEKFRDIVEAYDALCHEKESRNYVFVDHILKPGKISIQKITYDSFTQVRIKQGNVSLSGTPTYSENGQYTVVQSSGFGFGGSNRWINGKICLIEYDALLWVKDVEKPLNAQVSNNGRVLLLHTVKRDYSQISHPPKEFVDLGCKLTAMEKSGQEMFSYEFGSDSYHCAISPNGDMALVATLSPDNSIYFFDLDRIYSKGLKLENPGGLQKKGYWKYKHHARNGISKMQFKEDVIDVFTGNSTDIQYALRLDGTLLPEYAEELENLAKIKKQKPDQKVQSLIKMINSSKRHESVEGLTRLATFVSTKGSLPFYDRISKALLEYISTEDSEIFSIIWKIIRGMLKKQPIAVEPLIPILLSKLKKSFKGDKILMYLGELGGYNPKWVLNELPAIKQKLKSNDWEERRFSALALGYIGASDVNLVQDVLPQIIDYAANPDKVTEELGLSKKNRKVITIEGFEISLTSNEDYGATWLRDACIDTLGEIGKTFPKSVEFTIPLLEKISQIAPSEYTVQKALRAIQAIRGMYKAKFRHI